MAARLNAIAVRPGPARLKLSLDLDKNPDHADRANARAVLDIDAPEFKGVTTITATPVIAAVRGIDLDALARSEIGIESKMSSGQGRSLLTLLGLDRAIGGRRPGAIRGIGDRGVARAAAAESQAVGRRPRCRSAGHRGAVGVGAEGRRQPLGSPRQSRAVARSRSCDPLAQNISLSSRLTLAGSKLTFDDMDSAIGGARIRGRVALNLGDEKSVDGEVGMDTLDLASAFGLAIGAAGHDTSEPLGRGLLQGWRGRLAFQALRGALPGGGELRPVSGVIKGDGQSLTFDNLKGRSAAARRRRISRRNRR